MGWLRDLMEAAEPRVPSYGALARALLAAPDWPEGARPQPRSLEALLGKLDRGLELGWLAERPEVRVLLAQRLGCSPQALVRDRGAPASDPGVAGRENEIELESLRFGRRLELRREPLFPGLPAAALDPARWGRLWWLAADDAGRSLAGRWLAARELAVFVDARNASEAAARQPAGGRPLFLELHEDDDGDITREAPLCVAAPFPPRTDDFVLVRSPPLEACLPELLRWVAARLPTDTKLDIERAAAWFASGPLSSGAVTSIGIALGLCGALDEVGTRGGTGHPLGALARRWFAHRIAELSEGGHAELGWLRREGPELLLGLMTRLLLDPVGPWQAPREFEDWLALVPEELQREVDVEWMRALLATPDGPIRSRDVERAARRLPPGAFRVVRALSTLGNLRPETRDGALTLRPRWLGHAMLPEALHGLARSLPEVYGTALLSPHAAEAVTEALLQRLRGEDHGGLEDALDLEPEGSPAATAAVEAAHRVAGLALLEGQELPTELLAGLHAEWERLSVRIGDELPRPRVGYRVPPGSLLSDPIAWVAALAVTEGLTGRRRPPSPLDPWHASAPPPALPRLLSAIADELPALPEARAIEIFALVDRLRSTLGQLAEPWHPLEVPGALLDELTLGVASATSIARLTQLPHGLTALTALARRRGVDAAQIGGALLEAWLATQEPLAAAPWLQAALQAGTLRWSHLSPNGWRALLARDEPHLTLGEIDANTLTWLVAELPTLGLQSRLAFWRDAPEAAVRAALARHAPTTAAEAALLWQRVPDAILAELPRWLVEAVAVPLLDAAPPPQTAAVAAAIEPLHRDLLSDPILHASRRWAHARIAERAPDFARAFAVLTTIERDLRRLAGG